MCTPTAQAACQRLWAAFLEENVSEEVVDELEILALVQHLQWSQDPPAGEG